MTDRILSAEKVRAWVDSEALALSKFYRFGTGKIAHNILIELKRLRESIDSGQLDADRPKCPKCGDTGYIPIGDLAYQCDCGAKGGT